MADHYTHEYHAKNCHQAAMARRTFVQFVQVRTSGSSCCGRIVDAWTSPDGTDFFKIEGLIPLRFAASYPAKSVRQCSGVDGRCFCAGEPDAFAALTKQMKADATKQVASDLML